MTPLKAIKAKCIDCCESFAEVKRCPVPDCPLYLFRTGHNPNSARREYSEAEKAEMAKRLAEARKAKSL